MSETLNALVIGCGKIGGRLNQSRSDPAVMTHALAYVRDNRFALHACVDPDETMRRDFMERWSVPHGFASLEEALASGMRFDVASVASSTETHLSILKRLADTSVQGVLAEKPLGGSQTDAAEIVRRYEEINKPLLVCFLRRFDPAMSMLRDEIAEGRWGELESATVHYSRGAVNNGSHAADLLSFLTGRTDFRLVSTGRKIADGVPGDPTVDALLTLGNASVQFVACDGTKFAVFEIMLVFSNGVVSLEQNGFVCRRRPVEAGGMLPGIRRLGEASSETTGLATAFVRALDALFKVIHSGAEAPSTGRTALAAIGICEAIRISATRGD